MDDQLVIWLLYYQFKKKKELIKHLIDEVEVWMISHNGKKHNFENYKHFFIQKKKL